MKPAQSALRRRPQGESSSISPSTGGVNGLKLVRNTAQEIPWTKERRRSARKLDDSKNKYRVLFEDSAEACWLLDEKGFVDCNPAALAMFGFSTRADFKHPGDISPPNQSDGTPSRSAAQQRIAAALANGKDNFEWLHRRKN